MNGLLAETDRISIAKGMLSILQGFLLKQIRSPSTTPSQLQANAFSVYLIPACQLPNGFGSLRSSSAGKNT
jgi:hypothetical protein